MDFLLNEDHHELAALTRRIVARERTEAEPDGTGFDAGLWADLARAGVLSAGLPEALGGSGLGLLAHCAVLAEMGRAVAAVPYLESVVLAAGAVARFGTPDQQRGWAEPAGRGEVLLTAALAEEDGDDPVAPSTAAEQVNGHADGAMGSRAGGGGWRLSGVKTMVAAAPQANLILVPARTPHGAAVFLASPGDDGVTVQRQQVTGGCSMGRLVLADARLPVDRLLGDPGAGPEITGWLTAHGTVGLCAQQYGVLARALELTAGYAKDRVQFGRPIGSFQAVAQRLADAFIDVEAARLTMWQAAWLLSEGRPAQTAIATAKFWAADAGHRVAHTAVHVHGGMGIDSSYPLHRYFVAAKHHEFALGGATAQLRRIGAELAQSG
jgi:3-oxocholest-4-en-26-oyl-CoA dehydrogenase beta subunit